MQALVSDLARRWFMGHTQILILALAAAALTYLFWLRPRMLVVRRRLVEGRRRAALHEAFPTARPAGMSSVKAVAEQLSWAERDAASVEARLKKHAFTAPKAAALWEPAGEVFGRLAECVKKDPPALKLAELALNLRSLIEKSKESAEAASALDGAAHGLVVVEQGDALEYVYALNETPTAVATFDFGGLQAGDHSSVLTDALLPFDAQDGLESADALLAVTGQTFLDVGEQSLAPTLEPLVLAASENMDRAVFSLLASAGVEDAAADGISGVADMSFEPADGGLDIPIVTIGFSMYREVSKLLDDKLSMTRAAKHVALDVAGSVGGAKVGAAFGTAVLPGIGTLIGALAGAIVGRQITNSIKELPLTRVRTEYDQLRAEADASARRSSHEALRRVGEVISEEQKRYLQKIGECPRLSSGRRRRSLVPLAEQLGSGVEQAVLRARARLDAAVVEASRIQSDRWYHRLTGLAVDGGPSPVIESFRSSVEAGLSDMEKKAGSRSSKGQHPLETIIAISGHPALRYLHDTSRSTELAESLRRIFNSYAADARLWKLKAVGHYVKGRRAVRRAYGEEVRRHNDLYGSYKVKAEEIGKAMLKEMQALGKV
jgi:hypothetical protein